MSVYAILQKYNNTNTISRAIAASAPILQFTGLTPCEKFGQLVTADFAKESKECAEVIRKSWAAIDAVTADGKEE